MKRVLCVSESRKLIKKVISCIGDNIDYAVHISFYSNTTLDRFIQIKPEIIILDTKTLISYSTLLEYYNNYKWGSKTILLCDNSLEIEDINDQNTIVLQKSSLNEDSLLIALNNLYDNDYKEVSIKSIEKCSYENISIIPDFYNLILSKNLDEQSSIINEDKKRYLIKEFNRVGKVQVQWLENNEFLIVLKKTDINKVVPFSFLTEIISRSIESKYAAFFSENIDWRNYIKAYEEIKKMSKYSYFILNESISISRLKNSIKPIEIKEIDKITLNIFKSIFTLNQTEVNVKLYELYIHILKESFNLKILEYLHLNIRLIDNIITSIERESNTKIEFNYKTIEDELKGVIQLSTRFIERVRRIKVSDVTYKAVVYILNNYSYEISLDDTADNIGVTKVYLSRIFKSEIGITVLELIQILRTNVANYLLRYEDYKISEISNMIGYRDSHYFARFYKKRTGYSPEEYRRLYREN